jgi:Lantibiotic dehydratase, N terminus
LRSVTRDHSFREAVNWQNRAALANAVVKVAENVPTKPSAARRREEAVASYWQRYCAKNDTIGFFGPLAWGRVSDEGPPLAVRSGGLVRDRVVHLEAWGIQALAETIDSELRIPTGPHAERDLRAALEMHPDSSISERGFAMLERLESARDALDAAAPETLDAALRALDATFVELTGREPVRNPGRAYGARTLAYVDCMRDLDVTIGPALVNDMAPALQVLFEAGRWYCGQANAIAQRVIKRSLPAGGRAPFVPVLAQVMRSLMQLRPELAGEVAELQRRLADVLADSKPSTVGARAAAVFADRRPAWRHGRFQSTDLQIAARDEAAVAAGEFLAVIGDVHPGANPLAQAALANRHPDPPAMLRSIVNVVGRGVPVLLPPYGPGLGVDARTAPVTPDGGVYIAALPGTRAGESQRTWLPDELFAEAGDLVDRRGQLRVPLLEVFWLPIFTAALGAFDLSPDQPHAPRVTVGRTVLRRESWTVPACDVPQRAQDVPSFARDRGMPRRVFTKSPLERKPMYLDIDSPALARILCRQARHAAAAAPATQIRFTEMLPTPEQCWLQDPDGQRYVSELRIVAVDQNVRQA